MRASGVKDSSTGADSHIKTVIQQYTVKWFPKPECNSGSISEMILSCTVVRKTPPTLKSVFQPAERRVFFAYREKVRPGTGREAGLVHAGSGAPRIITIIAYSVRSTCSQAARPVFRTGEIISVYTEEAAVEARVLARICSLFDALRSQCF